MRDRQQDSGADKNGADCYYRTARSGVQRFNRRHFYLLIVYMILDREKIERIRTALKFHSKGMSISEIAQQLKMNRNSVAKYLEILLISGQVEVKAYGTSKIYSISRRIPVSAMMRFSSEMILMINADGIIIQANEAFLTFSGLSRNDVIGTLFSAIARAIFSNLSFQDILRIDPDNDAVPLETTTHRNGREYHLRVKAVSTTFDDGNEGLTIIIEDISEKWRAERALTEREQLYRGVLENIQDVYYRSDNEGNLIMASPSWASMLGYLTLEECIGRNIGNNFYMYPEKRKDFLQAVTSNGSVFDYEVVLRRKDGSPLYVATNSHLYYDAAGNPLGVEGIFRDISERRAASEKIHEYIGRIEFLSQKLIDFIEMESSESIYDRIASDLQILVPGAIILVNSFNAETGIVRVESSLMNDAERTIVMECLGRDLNGLQLPIDSMGLVSFRSGSLYRADLSLYEIAFKAIPENVCNTLESRLLIRDVFAIGFVRGNDVLGNITLILRKGERIPDSSLLEMYIRQASIALQRFLSDDARRKSEEIFTNLAQMSPLPIALIDPDGTYRFINGSFTKLFGYDLNDFHNGREWFLLAFPNQVYREKVIAAWKQDVQMSEVGEPRNRICVVQCKDQTQKEIIFRPVTLSDGKQFVIYEDISLLKETEKTRRLLSSIVESTGDAVIGKTTAGTIISWNRAAETLYGFSRDEMIGRHISVIIPPDKRPEMDAIFGQIRKGKSINNLETLRIRKDGTLIDVAVTMSPITDSDGSVTGVSTIARGIGQEKAEARLRENEEKYRALVENISVGVYRSTGDPSGKFIWGNQSLVSLLGFENLEDLKQATVSDLFVKEDGRKLLLDELKQTGFVRNRKLDLKRLDGREISVLVTALARFDQKGEILCINGLVEDITEQMQAERRIQNMTNEICGIIDFFPDAAFVIDDSKKVIAWNTGMENICGVSRRCVMGSPDYARSLSPLFQEHPPLIDLIDEPDPVIQEHYPDAVRSVNSLSAYMYLAADTPGRGARLRMIASALLNCNGKRIGAIQTFRNADIQSYSQGTVPAGSSADEDRTPWPAGNSLANLMYLGNALQLARDGIVILDLSARCIWVNDALVDMLGAGTSDAVIGKSVAHFVASEMRKQTLARLNGIRKDGHALFPLFLISPGGRIPVEASISVVADNQRVQLGYLAILRPISGYAIKGRIKEDLPKPKSAKQEKKG